MNVNDDRDGPAGDTLRGSITWKETRPMQGGEDYDEARYVRDAYGDEIRDLTFDGETEDEILEDAEQYLKANIDATTTADEGLHYLYTIENIEEGNEGDPATPEELERWKRGELTLYDCIYTLEIEPLEEV